MFSGQQMSQDGNNKKPKIFDYHNLFPFIKLFFYLFLSFIGSFATAVFTYISIYYFFIPPAIEDRQLHFIYDANCYHGEARLQYRIGYNKNYNNLNESSCTDPYFQLKISDQELFAFGQNYQVSILLFYPDTELNRKTGVFMLSLSLISSKGELILRSLRPTMIPYQSHYVAIVNTILLLPFYLIGIRREEFTSDIVMFDSFMDDPFRRVSMCHIQLHSATVQIIRARLIIHANYGWFQWFMFYFPVLTACFFSIIFTCIYFPFFLLLFYSCLSQSIEQCFKVVLLLLRRNVANDANDQSTNENEDDFPFHDPLGHVIKEEKQEGEEEIKS